MNYITLDGWQTIKDDICLKSAKKQGMGKIEEYQNIELQTAISHCAKLRIAVDIGAHVGITAFRLSQSFEHVHAFEVNTNLLPCLHHNLNMKGVHNCTTHPVGIGDVEKDVDIKTTNKSFGTHVDPDKKTGKYKIKTLDSFEIQNVDFIKIDAEGYEPLVIKGALKTIEKYKPIILYERKDHPERYGYKRDSIRDILMPLGYRMIRKLGKGEKNAVLGHRPGISPDV
tara:strand:- start:14692 stop:15372 length:681 start_codon:yes stop_codon:yes gene_type:complete